MNKIKATLIAASLLLLSQVGNAAGGKYMNIRYSLLGGPMLEFALGKLGLGINYSTNSYSTNSGSSLTSYTVNSTLTGGRLSIYSSGMGSHSWYAGVLAGAVNYKYSQTVLGTEFTANTTSTYSGAAAGYHWFWGALNLHLGLGALNLTIKGATLTSSTGVVSSAISDFSIALPGLDFGLGLAF